ncbi:MAG: hypothetical protein WC662_04735 [Candidatus Paceibacterota bacterium]|jgi:hypothetical protein
MSKRKLIILIIIILAIVLVIFGISFLSKPNPSTVSGQTGTNFFSNFFPFGRSTQTKQEPTSSTNISGFQPNETSPVIENWLIKVSSFPTAGYGLFMKERFTEMPTIIPNPSNLPLSGEATTTSPLDKGDLGGSKILPNPTPPTIEFIPTVRYVERANGNIYQTSADKIEERKITTTIIPKVYDAYFSNKGNFVSMRHLKNDGKTIETFAGSLPVEILGGDTANLSDIKGTFLPEGIIDISVAPDSSKVLYLFNFKDNAIGMTVDAITGQKTQVLNSPFTEWLSWWPNSRMITVTSKPSANSPGYMYAIDPDKKDFNKILGNINGLTTLTSPSGKLVLYANNNLSLSVFDIDTGSSNSLNIKTLPEKCVWNNTSEIIYCSVPRSATGNGYPDTWYQGEVSFSDDIWKVNLTNQNTLMVADLSIGGEEIDGIKLALDETETYLFFVNKKDSYLWKFNLK